jgi:hypothetical protein
LYHIVSQGEQKKERVLHTRVPAVLEAELKRFAENLRVPVSNLVRTLLEDAVGIADRATGRLRSLSVEAVRAAEAHERRARESGRRAEQAGDGELLGFQPLRLARASRCARCRATLAAGGDAFLALTDRPGPRRFYCARCASPKRGGER